MRLSLAVEHRDGNHTTVVLPPDLIRWEIKTGGKMADLATRLGMYDMAFMAWASLMRQTLITMPFDLWIDGLAAVEPIDVAAPVPTPGAN